MVNNSQPVQFSILMPTHNRGDVIAYAIESVLAQTVANFELFIVGDGCTDNTEAVVKDYIQKDPRVKWLPFSKGKGFGYGHRNGVLKRARGKYVAFAAHDDLWLSDHLATHLAYFSEHKDAVIAYTRPLWVHPDGTILPSSYNTDNPATKASFMTTHNEIPADCVVHTRQAMEKVGYWNAELSVAADWDLWKRIIRQSKSKTIGFISTPTTLHFRANWRTEKNSWSDHMKVLYESFARNGQTKQPLMIPSEGSEPQQRSAWQYLQKDAGVAELRRYCIALIDARVQETLDLEGEIARITESRLYQVTKAIKSLLSR